MAMVQKKGGWCALIKHAPPAGFSCYIQLLEGRDAVITHGAVHGDRVHAGVEGRCLLLRMRQGLLKTRTGVDVRVHAAAEASQIVPAGPSSTGAAVRIRSRTISGPSTTAMAIATPMTTARQRNIRSAGGPGSERDPGDV